MRRLRDRLVAAILSGLARLYDFAEIGTSMSGYYVRVAPDRTWSVEYALRTVAKRLRGGSE